MIGYLPRLTALIWINIIATRLNSSAAENNASTNPGTSSLGNFSLNLCIVKECLASFCFSLVNLYKKFINYEEWVNKEYI